MRAMKTTAEVALGELARRQRAEMLCSEANDRLRRGVEDARVALREHLHTALGHLNEDRTDVEAFSNDIEQGCDWVGMSSGLLGTIEVTATLLCMFSLRLRLLCIVCFIWGNVTLHFMLYLNWWLHCFVWLI